MKIDIRMPSGQVIHFEVDPNETIFSLKKKFEKETKIDPKISALIYDDKLLDDNETIDSCDLKDKSIIISSILWLD